MKHSWDPNRWSKNSSRPTGTKEDAKELNEFLDIVQAKVYEARRKLVESGLQVTCSSLTDIVSGNDERWKMLLNIFKEHNDRMKALIGNGYAKGTCDRFDTALKHTKTFIKLKYNQDDINIYALNSEFCAPSYFTLSILALIATTIVLTAINAAPAAGLNNIPQLFY